MDIKFKYREVFNDLYRSEKGLMAFTLYSRYNIPPSEAVEFINYYENLEIISIDGEQRIKLTSKGKNEILGILNKIGKSNISTNSSYVIALSNTLVSVILIILLHTVCISSWSCEVSNRFPL